MSNPIVRANCPTCGEVVLTTGDLGLHVGEDQSQFVFICPRCRQRVRHDVPAGIVHILQAAGVHELAPEPDLISEDEMAQFLDDFERVDCLDQLRRLGRDA